MSDREQATLTADGQAIFARRDGARREGDTTHTKDAGRSSPATHMWVHAMPKSLHVAGAFPRGAAETRASAATWKGVVEGEGGGGGDRAGWVARVGRGGREGPRGTRAKGAGDGRTYVGYGARPLKYHTWEALYGQEARFEALLDVGGDGDD